MLELPDDDTQLAGHPMPVQLYATAPERPWRGDALQPWLHHRSALGYPLVASQRRRSCLAYVAPPAPDQIRAHERLTSSTKVKLEKVVGVFKRSSVACSAGPVVILATGVRMGLPASLSSLTVGLGSDENQAGAILDLTRARSTTTCIDVDHGHPEQFIGSSGII